ncbi:hypothetical protein AB0N09_18880 [Streptomyces erythrochromogenes]|uniref:hypothetical protein n=1 Tax=Streptomyces erythrochromogenes TaxID=285574 RepID=UPI003430CD97
MSRESTAAGSGWSAVVYGRTYRIDRWWRALPEGVEGATPGGPIGRTVLAVVCGGTRLDAGPRFVLDRGAHGVLVGAACRMPLLGPEMAHDEHGRPLYGFVGWHHPDRAVPHDLPGLRELEAAFPHWAAATYRAWAGPLWDAAREPDAVTLPSVPEPAPWAQHARSADPAAALRWPPAHPADVHLLPAEQAAGLWDAALAAGPMADCVLTTGWQQSRDAREPGLTHSCCADVTEYRRAPHTAPPTPARAAERAPDPVRERERERERKPARRPREKDGKGLLGWVSDVLRSVIDGDRTDGRPRPAARPRPAPQSGTARQPYLTGSAAYGPPEPPEPPVQGLLARAHAVDAEQASFEGYFGALGTPPPGGHLADDSRTAPGPGSVAAGGPSAAPGGSGAVADPPTGPGAAPASGGPAGRDGGTDASSVPVSVPAGEGPRTAPGPGGVVGAGWPSAAPGGSGAVADPPTGPGRGMTPASGAAAHGGDADAVGPRTASGPGGPARPGTTAAVDGAGTEPAPDAAAGTRTGQTGTPAGAWGVLTPDADGRAGRGHDAPDDPAPDPDGPNRSHPGGSA